MILIMSKSNLQNSIKRFNLKVSVCYKTYSVLSILLKFCIDNLLAININYTKFHDFFY